MSPRSDEFMAVARRRLVAARANLEAGFYDVALGAAYYAAWSAARAALSERDEYAKTHRGTWVRFREVFAGQGFDLEVLADAQSLQKPREAVDYGTVLPDQAEARDALEAAERFVAEVDRRF